MRQVHRHNRYVVKTQIRGAKRSLIWDSRSPMGLGSPFRWILEKTQTGVRLRDLAKAGSENPHEQFINFVESDLKKGIEFKLKELNIALQPLRSIAPPYLSPVQISDKPTGNSVQQLFVYSGVRRTTIESTPVHSAYVAYSNGNPIFTLSYTQNGIKFKMLLNGVKLKHKGKPPLSLKPGQNWALSNDELWGTTLFRGRNWWRFNLVAVPARLPAESAPSADDLENRTFKYYTRGIAAFMVAAALFAFLLPKSSKTPAEILQAAPSAKILHKPKPPVFAAKKALQEKPAEIAETKTDKPPVVAAKSVPATQNKKVEQKLTTPVVAAKSAPAPTKVSPATAAAIKQAKLFKEAFGGALASLDKNSIKHKSSAATQQAPSHELFNAQKSGLTATEIKPTAHLGGTQINGIGGGGLRGSSDKRGIASGSSTGVGYGSSDKVTTGSESDGSFVNFGEGAQSIDDGLTKDEVGAVIHAHMAEIRYCHESSMVQNPKVEGKVVLDFKINGLGRVTSASIQSSSLSEDSLAECIRRRLVTWAFPKPKGGVTVSVAYPFSFKTLERE